MVERRPLVVVAGQAREMPVGDTVPADATALGLHALQDAAVVAGGTVPAGRTGVASAAGNYMAPTPETFVGNPPRRFGFRNDHTAEVTLSIPDQFGAATAVTILPGQARIYRQVTTSGYGLEEGIPLAQLDLRFVRPTVVDAKGDLLVGTADNTVARLPAGITGQRLTVDPATASGVKWETPAASGFRATTFCEATAQGTNQNVPASFTTFNLPSTKVDPGNNFDSTSSIYTVREAGLYLIIAFWRVPDGVGANVSHGLGVHTSNSDGTWFQWANTISGRKSRNYQRMVDLPVGAQLRLFGYSEGNFAVEFASMQIVRIG